jgi:EpsD family peptidyl-prolyl cis-trans isomerase
MNGRTKNVCALASGILASALLAACGDGAETTTQVVARVNDTEITISQLRAALFAKGVIEPSAEATRQALEGLVNEQLIVNAALQAELDRDPAVVQTLENARRQILARAYLDRVVFPKQAITAEEQTAYFKSNPALFAQRRVYQLAAFTCPSTGLTGALLDTLGTAATVETVSAALAQEHVTCESQTLTRAAEQLPLEQLPQFGSAAVGDVIVQPAQGEETVLMLITGIQNSPLGFESAQPIIQQYLANLRNAAALDSHLKEARAAAAISHTESALVSAAAPAAAPAAEAERSALEHGAAVLN